MLEREFREFLAAGSTMLRMWAALDEELGALRLYGVKV